MQDPRSLEAAEIVQELQALRGEMQRCASRMFDLSQTLYSKVRRAPSDDYTSRYVTFANSWSRFASMVDSSLRRTSGAIRLVETIQQEKVAKEEEQAERLAQERLRQKRVEASNPTPDLAELYGHEMVSYVASK